MRVGGWPNALHRHKPCAAVLIFTWVITTIPGQAYALPSDWTVENGTVSFEQTDPQTLHIAASDQAIVGFQTFDIGASETVQVHQPSSTSSFLSRVNGGAYSELAGTLIANGRFFLVNPAGIHIADTARIEAASFVASSLNIANADFLEGKLHFDRFPGQVPAAVVNEGTLLVNSEGLVALLGGAVANHGQILAQTGSVALGSGNKITLTFDPENRWALSIDEPLDQIATGLNGEPVSSAIEQIGMISAAGGQVLVKARALEGLFDQVVNQEGLIEAVSVVERSGRIELVGEGGIFRQAGILRVDASAQAPDAGAAFLTGTRIIQRGTVSANSAHGGQAGQIQVVSVGGTLLTEGSLLEARGSGQAGQGGDIRVNAIQGNTQMRAGSQINVSGGSLSGNAGFIDLSAAEQLGFHGQMIGIAAPGYAGGRVTFDPRNINVANSGTQSVEGGDVPPGTPDEQFTESPGATLTFDPRAGGAFTGFQEIHLQATRDININSPWDLNASVGPTGIPSLILEAQRHIRVNQNLSAANGDITLRANRNVALARNRSITIAGTGSLAITADSDGNGTGTFVQGLNSTLQSAGGDITIRGGGAMTLRTIHAGSGDVSITTTHGKNIVDDNDNSTRITADLLTLNAGGRIGASGATAQIDASANTLNAAAGKGSIFLANDRALLVNSAATTSVGSDITVSTSAGDLTLGTLTAADDITLSAAGSVLSSNSLVTGDQLTVTAGIGDLVIGKLSAGGGVNLTALSGSVLDGNGPAVNLTASEPSSIVAAGVIGDLSDPIEVSVSGAALSISAGSQMGGVSADLSGSVTPSGTLDILNTPPGQVIFNGNVLFQPPTPPPTPLPTPVPAPAPIVIPPVPLPGPIPAPVDAAAAPDRFGFRDFFGQILSGFFSSERQQRLRSAGG